MRWMAGVSTLVLAATLVAPVEAGLRRLAGPMMVMGPEAERREQTLVTAVKWNTSLDEALAQARAENKPVFWVHMLGQIDGPT